MKLLTRIAATAAALTCLSVAAPGLSQAQPTAASASSTSSSAAVPACQNADLKVSRKYAGSGAGHEFVKIRIKNISGHRCRTGGYGGVSFVGDGNGTQIGHAAIRIGSGGKSFVLKPGKRLVSLLDLTRAGAYDEDECRPAKVDGFRVYVPNATKSQFVAYPYVGCRDSSVHLIHQRPYRRP